MIFKKRSTVVTLGLNRLPAAQPLANKPEVAGSPDQPDLLPVSPAEPAEPGGERKETAVREELLPAGDSAADQPVMPDHPCAAAGPPAMTMQTVADPEKGMAEEASCRNVHPAVSEDSIVPGPAAAVPETDNRPLESFPADSVVRSSELEETRIASSLQVEVPPAPPAMEIMGGLPVLPLGLTPAGEPPDNANCPYCLQTTPLNSSQCTNCGAGMTAGELPVSASPAPEPAGECQVEAVAIPNEPVLADRTRKLMVKPAPAILSETTLFVPAQLIHLGQGELAYQLKFGAASIGRGKENDLVFPDDEFISRRHCEIRYHKYQYSLRDLQSANGTFVNDVKVLETALRDGDLIQVGSLRFVFDDPMEKMKKKRVALHQQE